MSKPTSLTYNSPTFKLGHHHEEQWLDASRTPFAEAKSLLKPYPRRADGRSRPFTNRQLGEVRWPERIRPFSDDEMASGGQLSLL
jgi:hypothetical protein